MNRRLPKLLFFLAQVATWPVLAECLYCDEWRVFSGTPYFPGAIATITESSITLPSCSSSDYDLVRSAPSKQFGPVCTEHYLRLRSMPSCSQIPARKLRPIIKVVACPRTQWGNEELELSLLQDGIDPVNFDPQFYGASWRLIRSMYNPCDSGGGHGQWMCAQFALEHAEAELEALSNTDSASARRQWLLNRDLKCKKKGDGLSESWSYREEDVCKLNFTKERIAELKRHSKYKGFLSK